MLQASSSPQLSVGVKSENRTAVRIWSLTFTSTINMIRTEC